MSILQVVCPECAAKLSSKAGFTAGQKIKCPKCATVFAVAVPKKPVVLEEDDDDERPAPKKKKPVVLDDEDDEPRPAKKKKPVVLDDDDEDEDERPKKKKKGKKAAEKSYASSPLRFVILGVLVVVMLVMGYFLYRKFTREDGGPTDKAPPTTGGPTGPTEPPPREDGEPSYLGPKLPKERIPAAKAKASQLVGKWKLRNPVPGRSLTLEFTAGGTGRRVIDHGTIGDFASTDNPFTWQITGVKGNDVDLQRKVQAGSTNSFSIVFESVWLGTGRNGATELWFTAFQELQPFKLSENPPGGGFYDVALVKE